ncbi:MAG TPA: cytochrome P450 [Candidatus Binatia bacterium]|nr:cytochrome P450 [Candidatus Binatia bacterium]
MSLLTEEMRRDPFGLYRQIRSTSPVVHVPEGDLWMVFDYDRVKRVLQDDAAFRSDATESGRKNLDWLIFLDPPRHTKLRALISRAFTPKSVASLEPRIRELSRELLDATVERGAMDLAADYAIPLPLMVISEMLGAPVADRPLFRRWSDVILILSYSLTPGPEAERAVAAYREVTEEMRSYVARLIADRRAQPRDDLLTRLVHAEVDGDRLSEAEILGFFQLLLIAGHETTTNLVDNAILCFLESPGELARVRATPELLPSAIEEVLRYRSPVQWMFRSTREAVDLDGHAIPAGKLVLPVIGSANRDPLRFADPDRFDVARDPNPHVAFGHGIHFCLGAPLSRLEAKVALADLLERLHELELASDDPWEPRKALHVHGPARLPIRFAPAPPSTGRAG